MDKSEAQGIAVAAVLNALLNEMDKTAEGKLTVSRIAQASNQRGVLRGREAGDASAVLREIRMIFAGTQVGAGMAAPSRQGTSSPGA